MHKRVCVKRQCIYIFTGNIWMTLVGYWMNYILFLACDSCYPDDDGVLSGRNFLKALCEILKMKSLLESFGTFLSISLQHFLDDGSLIQSIDKD